MHDYRPPVTMDWLMDDSIAPGAGVSLARMTLAPDATSEAHRHPNCSEAIHLLSGRIRQRIGDVWHEMTAGDTVLIPQNTVHQSRAIGTDPAIMMIAYSAGTRLYETDK